MHRWTAALIQLIKSMQAQVVRATFHVGLRKGHAECRAERGDVFEEDLLLEILGAGGHEHALTAQNRRDQIREGLPGACAGFGQQHAAIFEHAGDAGGHVQLTRARFEVRHRTRERAVGPEGLGG